MPTVSPAQAGSRRWELNPGLPYEVTESLNPSLLPPRIFSSRKLESEPEVSIELKTFDKKSGHLNADLT